MKFNGTPGPWKVKEVDDDEISEMSSTMLVSGSIVLACIGPTSHTDLKSDNANANLMAAAPDLLKVLQKLLSIYGRELSEFKSAKAAISKALGDE
ncbi:TPA: hypothetical protein ACJIWE_000708 [Enterobacter roggenkampii]